MEIAFAQNGKPLNDKLLLVMKVSNARHFCSELAGTINLLPLGSEDRIISVELKGKFGPGQDPQFHAPSA